MSKHSEQLRALFGRPGVVRLMGAHNALGAKLVERAGFEGVWSSGLEISASFGVPDADILTMSEFLAAAQSMASAVNIPVVADVDTGYGNAMNVIRMVEQFEAAGVAAVCMEDKLFPKVNSFIPGRQDLASVAEFVGKIMAAKAAQRNPEFMVIARVEALIAGLGLEEALRRAHAYSRAGADAILIHEKSKSPQTIIDFARAWDFSVPLVIVPTTYYKTTIQEFEQVGIKVVIYANQGLRSSIKAMEETFSEILEAGCTAPVESKIAPMSFIFELQGFPQLKQNEETFLRSEKKHVRAMIPAAGDHMHEYSIKDLAADLPLAMLDINGKPLLQRQAETLNASGIGDITVVGGYKRDKIRVDGIKLACNHEWQTTGNMSSILCAGDPKDAWTLIAYCDILFDRETVEKLMKSDADITLLVDNTYQSRYRTGLGINLVTLSNARPGPRRALSAHNPEVIVKIGANIPPAEAHCEFAGLAFFSSRGFQLLRQVYQECLEQESDEPFHEAGSVQTAALADVLQELIDRGHTVHGLEVSSGWMELRSFEDYKLAHSMIR